MQINEKHYQYFKNCEYKPQGAVGIEPKKWYKSLGIPLPIDENNLLDTKLSRKEVFGFIKSNDDVLVNVITIMSWGGMHRKSARLFFSNYLNWVNDLNNIKSLDRKSAYDVFKNLRENNKLKGMGPAYYTKLIYFLCNGYIMDQWSTKSYNLLSMDNKIIIGSSVSDSNTSNDYETFCQFIEYIAFDIGVTPNQIEERMFSSGGKIKGSWRKYIISVDLNEN